MRSKIYLFAGIWLTSIGIAGPLAYGLALVAPHLFRAETLMGTVLVMASMVFPFLTSPAVIYSGVRYLLIAQRKSVDNKTIFYSAIFQLLTIPGSIGVLAGNIPCFEGPPDGFCAMFSLPFLFLNSVFWIGGFIVLGRGLYLLKKAIR